MTYQSSLPFIDSHATLVDASPLATWDALLVVVAAAFGRRYGQPIAQLLGCDPAQRSGAGLSAPGSTLPGIRVAAAEAGRRLALEGRHRFSRYQLVFTLEPVEGTRCRLRAETRAAFPGLAGRGYRALVIGTRGHLLVVRSMLAAVRARA